MKFAYVLLRSAVCIAASMIASDLVGTGMDKLRDKFTKSKN